MNNQKYAPIDTPIQDMIKHVLSCCFFLFFTSSHIEEIYEAKNKNDIVVGEVVKGKVVDSEEYVR